VDDTAGLFERVGMRSVSVGIDDHGPRALGSTLHTLSPVHSIYLHTISPIIDYRNTDIVTSCIPGMTQLSASLGHALAQPVKALQNRLHRRRRRDRAGARMPTEIIEGILDHLAPPDLHQAVLVNRRFDQLAVPRLYSSIHQKGSDFETLWKYWDIIRDEPDLAGALRSVTFDSNFNLAPPDTHGFAREARYGRLGTDGVVYLLLRRAPNLRHLRVLHPSLSVGPPFQPSLPLYLSSIQERLSQNTPFPTHFENLVELEFSTKGLSWSCIAPLFCLPSLKRLYIRDGEEWGNVEQHSVDCLQPWTSPIEDLDFEYCTISAKTLSLEVCACTALRKIEYHGCIIGSFGDHMEFYNNLQHHRDTLQSLSSADGTPGMPTINLSRFHALRHVGLHCSRVTPNQLPRSIQTITIYTTWLDERTFNYFPCCRLARAFQEAGLVSSVRVTLYHVDRVTSPRGFPSLIPDIFLKHGLPVSFCIRPNTFRLSKSSRPPCLLSQTFIGINLSKSDRSSRRFGSSAREQQRT
jgi:hypothetical protein